MPHAPFVPLRVFSSYTMLEGAIEPKAIAKHARNLGFPAAALTDRNGLYAAMAFSDACKSEGVQPIIGSMLCVARPGRRSEEHTSELQSLMRISYAVFCLKNTIYHSNTLQHMSNNLRTVR